MTNKESTYFTKDKMLDIQKVRQSVINDSQLIQGLFMRMNLIGYFKAAKELTGSREASTEELRLSYKALKKSVFLDRELYYCDKDKALPIEELTVGELLEAAEKNLLSPPQNMPRKDAQALCRLIVEELLIIPLSLIKHSAAADPYTDISSDTNAPPQSQP